ncbi:MAG: flagellar basal body-associated FliL family protein [Candidatus Berkiella sp.]
MVDEADKGSEQTSKPKMNKMILGLVGFLGVFFIAMIVGLVMILKMPTTVSQAEQEPVVQAQSDEVVKTQEKEAPKEHKVESKAKHGNEGEKPQFYKLRPVMVVNIPSAEKSRYLQVDVELMARSASGLENIETYSPIIRNDLIILFSTQRYEDLLTLEGKELLRKKALETVQKVMKQNTGDPTVEQVLFTNFVSQ